MSAGDHMAAARMFTDDGCFRFPGSHELGGDYRGKAANRGMQYVRLAWGKIVEDEIYEDTETVASEVAHAHALAAA
jgi:hypothetical protein